MSRISGVHITHLAILCRYFTLSLHTRKCYAPVFGQTFAPRAKLCLRFGADFYISETICFKFQADFCRQKALCLEFQTDCSNSGARRHKIRSYHRKLKMNCPEIRTDHAVSRMICSRFQDMRSNRGRGFSYLPIMMFTICTISAILTTPSLFISAACTSNIPVDVGLPIM